ncbi:MAG: YdcF family protein [Alphaproteobacteria bacterium]|nr:MAG: YdcF family protein [Alphaproteobacteria bacterium]
MERASLFSGGALIAVGMSLIYLAVLVAIGLSARPRPGELAVVLGNTVAAGQPSPRLRARLDVAVGLFRAGLVRRVMVSGGIEPSGGDEAAVMGRYLVAEGIPKAAIVEDQFGDDTFATARHTAGLLGSGEGVVVVTQWFHVPRTMLAMRRHGLREVSAAWPRYAEWRDVYSFLREAVALPVYAVRSVAPCEGGGTSRQQS